MEKKAALKYAEFPKLGAAYYPECWDEEQQIADVEYMKKAGITVVRIGEFAWSQMEPQEGDFRFAWLRRVMNRLAQAGIGVILCTPSATPPIWLEEMDPTMMRRDDGGRTMQHGSRRNACSNNETYRFYAARIAQKLGEKFGKDPQVLGWQVDNEIYLNGNGCFCATCRAKFTRYLRERYGTIQELNRRWGLSTWSQTYDRFDQVPPATSYVWHNPHLKLEWLRFNSLSHVDFIRMQVDILHRYTKAPVGTDVVPMSAIDHAAIADFTDILQFNHYTNEDELEQVTWWFDYMRSLKDRPFWVTETSTCWNGATYPLAGLRPEGFCRANSWLPIVLGGEANMYWLWRQHRAGHELMHGSVLQASGQPIYAFGEVAQTGAEYHRASAFLTATTVVADTAIMKSTLNEQMFEFQPIAPPVRDGGLPVDREIHRAVTRAGIRPDVIAPSKDLSRYRLLFTPAMMTLEEGDVRERIVRWVENGGTWVVGPLTDLRDELGAHYPDRQTGSLEKLIGCRLIQQCTDPKHYLTCRWTQSGELFQPQRWLELFEAAGDAESLVEVSQGHTALVGKSLLLRKPYGQGTILVLGTLPAPEDLARVITLAAAISGAERLELEGTVAAAHRKGADCEGLAVQEIGGAAAAVRFSGQLTDRLTGETFEGYAPLEPYQTRILERTETTE